METAKDIIEPMRSLPKQAILILLFSGALSVAFLDSERYYLAWVAFVPLLFAIEKTSLAQAYVIGLVSGLLLYASGTYWILDFITIAKDTTDTNNYWLAFIYWLYCANQIAILVLLFSWLRKKTNVHDFILFPLVVAVITSKFPMLFSMRLGESQYEFSQSLQAVEFFGVHGLDAIIALFNIVIFRMLNRFITKSSENKAELRWQYGIAVSLIFTWFVYGIYAFSSWEKSVDDWSSLKVGIVQPNEVPKVGRKIVYPGYSYSYPPEIEMTKRLASEHAELIIWPEAHPKEYLNQPNVKSAFQNTVKTIGAGLLFQDLRLIRDPANNSIVTRHNTAIMLASSGEQVGTYNKLIRIPFGEYIPLVDEDSVIYQWLKNFLGGFLVPYSAGDSYQVFEHPSVNIVPLICYETTFPEFVGEAVSETRQQSDDANGTMLVGLSNDGWFGSTHQPYQHIMASTLRAVENRLPLVHVANNGPSIVVSPSGKVVFRSDFQRAGGYLVEVPYSSDLHGSFYSRHPTLFVNLSCLLMAFLIFYAILPSTLKERLVLKFNSNSHSHSNSKEHTE